MRRAEELLADILGAAELITDQCRDLDKPRLVARFSQGFTPFAASIGFGLVVVGEACAGLLKTDPDVASRQPGVDWQGFVRLRHVVAHPYSRLHAERLWDAIEDELPMLERAARSELAWRQTPP